MTRSVVQALHPAAHRLATLTDPPPAFLSGYLGGVLNLACSAQGGIPQALARLPNLEILMFQNCGLTCAATCRTFLFLSRPWSQLHAPSWP